MNKRLHFLLVCDSKSQQVYTKVQLKKIFPHSTLEIFDNGRDAIKRIQKNHFDLLITALNLSDEKYTGWNVMKCCYNAGKPTLIVSSCSILERLKLYTYDVDRKRVGFLGKPVKDIDYENIINKLLNNKISETTMLKKLMKRFIT